MPATLLSSIVDGRQHEKVCRLRNSDFVVNKIIGMSFKGGNNNSSNLNYKNPRKNAREMRLDFMNSQAELIAQKKR